MVKQRKINVKIKSFHVKLDPIYLTKSPPNFGGRNIDLHGLEIEGKNVQKDSFGKIWLNRIGIA